MSPLPGATDLFPGGRGRVAAGNGICTLHFHSHRRVVKAVVSWLLPVAGALGLLAACASSTGPGDVVSAGADTPDYRQSKADVVVLNFFDMYCHTCQTMAPHSKEIQRMVRDRSGGTRVDFYAIGWGNTPLESEQYRKRYQVSYPVIPDRDLSISRRFGKFRPPLMIVLERRGGTLMEKARFTDLRGEKEGIVSKILP